MKNSRRSSNLIISGSAGFIAAFLKRVCPALIALFVLSCGIPLLHAEDAQIDITGLEKTYNAEAQGVTISTVPPGLAYDVTYSGTTATGSPYSDSTPPTDSGSYQVSVSVNGGTYTGSAAATLTIAPANLSNVLTVGPGSGTFGEGVNYTYYIETPISKIGGFGPNELNVHYEGTAPNASSDPYGNNYGYSYTADQGYWNQDGNYSSNPNAGNFRAYPKTCSWHEYC